MKKLIFFILLLFLQTVCFADYKITQYYGVYNGFDMPIKKEWRTNKWEIVYGGMVANSAIPLIKFINDKGKSVVLSTPFSIEEL